MTTDNTLAERPAPWKVRLVNAETEAGVKYKLAELVDANGRHVPGTMLCREGQAEADMLLFIAANVNIGSALYADVMEAK